MTALTEPGWPRPIIGGWPIPWVATPDNLGKMDPARHGRSVEDLICQVCGHGHEPGADIFFCCNKPRHRAGWLALALDDAIMHERCAQLAVGRCPMLLQLARDRSLLVLRAKVEDVKVTVDENAEEDRLGVNGEDCELIHGP